ncbi:MAG: hypothetical protein OXD30_02520 [Bryobacterales bacterium]|nr:hypothetical protein [Bryobacterales bacterium]
MLFATNVIVLTALSAKGNFQGFPALAFTFAVEDDSVPGVLVNEKRSFQSAYEDVVAPWLPSLGVYDITEYDVGIREGLSEELRRKFCHHLLVVLTLAGGNGGAGGNAPKGDSPSAVAQALLETPNEHTHFHALSTPVLVSLIKYDELPASTAAAVEQRAIVRADQQVFQH